MGLGHERFDPDLNAVASDYRYSESNHRAFYRRWSQLMTAESWDELGAEPESRSTRPVTAGMMGGS